MSLFKAHNINNYHRNRFIHSWKTDSDHFFIPFVNLCYVHSKKLPFELLYHGAVLQIIISSIKTVL